MIIQHDRKTVYTDPFYNADTRKISEPKEGKQQIVTTSATSEHVFRQGFSSKKNDVITACIHYDYWDFLAVLIMLSDLRGAVVGWSLWMRWTT